jgi:hypothetical protein
METSSALPGRLSTVNENRSVCRPSNGFSGAAPDDVIPLVQRFVAAHGIAAVSVVAADAA